jgi:peptidoglycan/xylan/chitin deacetylase (PgdA/CDA1 family)
MRSVGVFAGLRAANGARALILTYHRFSQAEDGAALPARVFDEQLKFLTRHYRVVPLAQLADCLLRGEPFPHRAAAITIDDGYRDAYEIAFPLLRRHGAPATLFVVTDFLDGKAWLWTDKMRFLLERSPVGRLRATVDGRELDIELGDSVARRATATRLNSLLKGMPQEMREEGITRIASALRVRLPDRPPAEFAPVTWREARELDAAGVQIGSHTVTHPILTKSSDAQLRQELAASYARLADALRRKVDLFCYPNGDYDDRVRHEVARAGYRCAVTVEHGLVGSGSDPLTLRRIHTEDDYTHFLQSTSGFEEVKDKLRRRHSPKVVRTANDV